MFEFIFPEDVETPRSVNAVERARLFDSKVQKKETLTTKFRAMRIQTVRPDQNLQIH